MSTKQFPAVRTGTNCLTRAEDRIAEAFALSDTLQAALGVDSSDDATESIYIDQVNDPENDEAFTIEELEERGSAVTVMATPNGSVSINYDNAGEQQIGLEIVAVFERFIPTDSEGDQYCQQREVKNIVVTVGTEVGQHLRTTYGPLWLQSIVLTHPEPTVEYRDEVVLGKRHGCQFIFQIGPGGETDE